MALRRAARKLASPWGGVAVLLIESVYLVLGTVTVANSAAASDAV
jgi:hypothetical protein